MQAGLLRDWVEIQQETVERDQLGGETRKWETILRTRARIQDKSGDLKEENREAVFTAIKNVSIRYRPGITRNMRLSWGGENYRILSIDRNRKNMSWDIKCELINE
ncbi:phage head closure protein [Bacteroides mediterraneensis]|uniref:phage head closure protein n=1 Tax=Bacteroides mediterraneensis TaxID=1841856 RepID=UPI0019577FE8|nr:phage head closure protein [Bacteroides mediterraneensis]MBM6781446.1 phage head closure protein [Bacteroides mediterraneensis]